MATRRRAEAACPPCKSKKARCSDFRPCARCSLLGGEGCTDRVNKHTVRTTSSLITAGLSKSIHPYFYNFYLVAICAVRQRRPFPFVTSASTALTLSSVDALIKFRETRHFAQDGADFRHARHTGTYRPLCHPVPIVDLKTQFRLGGVDVGGSGGAWEGGPVPRGLEAVPAAVGGDRVRRWSRWHCPLCRRSILKNDERLSNCVSGDPPAIHCQRLIQFTSRLSIAAQRQAVRSP